MRIKFAVLFLSLVHIGGAATIQFVGVPTGVNDGSYYVTPYQITIDGSTQDVTCYDFLDDVNYGDTWQANILDLADAANSGFFAHGSLATYERIAWLSAQTYTDSAEEIGLQYAIWDVFGSTNLTSPDTLIFEQEADAAAAENYAGFNFSGFEFIQEIGAVAGASGTKQAFVYQTTVSTAIALLSPSSPIPEPETVTLFVMGVLLLMLGKANWWRTYWTVTTGPAGVWTPFTVASRG